MTLQNHRNAVSVGFNVALKSIGACMLLCALTTVGHARDYDFSAAFGRGDLRQVDIAIDGENRRFLTYTPSSSQGGPGSGTARLRPVLFVLHGFGGTAELSRYYGFEKVADENDLLVVYPEGPGKQWSVGKNFPHAEITIQRRDELAYFRRMLDEVSQRFHGQVDMSRAYVIGQSMGGLMAITLACEMSDSFHGFVAVVSGMTTGHQNDCEPGIVRPLMLIAGSEDTLMPATNGREKAIEGIDGELIWLLPFTDGLAFWAEKSGCTQGPTTITVPKRLAPVHDATFVQRTDYSDCRGGSVSGLWVEGMGHRWPGSRFQEHLGELLGQENLAEMLGPATEELQAPQEIWAFVSQSAAMEEN